MAESFVLSAFLCTFAAVILNRQRRSLVARALLAVYLPLLLLTMLHVHRGAVYVEDACYQCVHHEPHAGHITAQTFHLHDCVLCQLTTLQYVPAAVIGIAFVLRLCLGSVLWPSQRVPVAAIARQSTRAPPLW